ncbi:hypothetical protein INH39_03610 [Massilia violaceinigra]|uniref:Uncharacterized protein n=1 Tax=Massilia violaceinigra TaxID=2045208 RepID=A0ABY4A7S9_9BURK|nr:hypothetical protein [Massilia violaceinigra]UOD30835.1 hypothetical protein INH39_03610 [Massilia violaceinigra]
MTDLPHRINTTFAAALALALHAPSGFARERLECVLPQGGRIVMEAHCKAPPGVRRQECDDRYDTRYLPAGGGAALALGETNLENADHAATPASMCARFYASGDAVHVPPTYDGQYRSIVNGHIVALTVERPGDETLQTEADRNAAPDVLTYTGYRRVAALGTTWVMEEAFTRRYRGYYAGAGMERAPLSHVVRMQSADEGVSWSEPVISKTSRLFTIGKSVLDQPDAARPAFAPEEDRRRDRRARLAQGMPMLIRCRLPDHSEFVLTGKQSSDDEVKREWGGARSMFVPLVSIAYVAAPGAAAIEVEPELSLLSFVANVPRPKRDEHCGSAGIANGVPYIGISMLDQQRKQFRRLTYPDKIWYPGTLPRQAAQALARDGLVWGRQVEPPVAATRRGKLLALEYPVVPDGCGGGDPHHVRPPVCTVSAVLRSESDDNGMTWSDLAFSTTSWIFAPGQPVDQQPGRATLAGD